MIFLIVCFASFLQSLSAKECNCGLENTATRIINGTRSSGHFPWVVKVTKSSSRSQSYCTGSLISNSFVLTAAHCVPSNNNASAMRVFLNQDCNDDLSMASDGEGQSAESNESGLEVMRVIRNRRYVYGWFGGSDIALLELRIPLPPDQVMPICLTDTKLFDNFLVAGWGKVNNGTSGVKSNKCLHEADLEVVSNKRCWHTFPLANFNFVLCAGGDKGICNGDSGGPLMTRKFGRIFQAGVTSFTSNGCLSNRPSAFERIAPHVKWILRNSRNTVCVP